jgi:hypothetical protein
MFNSPIYVRADAPPKAQRTNWLPAPKDGEFTLYCRAYWPKPALDVRINPAIGPYF